MASSFSLGQHYESLISDLVSSGRYATASEVMRDSLRLLEEREELRKVRLDALREEIRRGRESGPGVPAEEVFDRLERRYADKRES
jgi:antitoxin ParD1/3/4